MSKSFHLQMKVSTALEMLGNTRDRKTLIKMFDMPEDEIRTQLEQLIAKGKLFIPTEGCDTDDPSLCFEVLEVSQNAGIDVIRAAYRAKLKVVHPDVGGSSEEFMELQKAYRESGAK